MALNEAHPIRTSINETVHFKSLPSVLVTLIKNLGNWEQLYKCSLKSADSHNCVFSCTKWKSSVR